MLLFHTNARFEIYRDDPVDVSLEHDDVSHIALPFAQKIPCILASPNEI